MILSNINKCGNSMKMNDKEENDYNLRKNEFDWYIEELNKIYVYDKGRAKKIARRGLKDLGLLKETISFKSLGIDKEISIIVIICILITLCCFLTPNASSLMMYIFGVIFFLVGIFVGLEVTVFGLIFLFSHGGSGLAIMILSLFGMGDSSDFNQIFNNPVFTDGGIPKNMLIYLCVLALVFISAIIYTIFHNLSPTLKQNKKHMIRILLLYFIAILLTALFFKFFI